MHVFLFHLIPVVTTRQAECPPSPSLMTALPLCPCALLQVDRTPAALAVQADEKLTYAELNRRANQLAHYLRFLGVGPEVLVPVLMERCAAITVCWLAVLKAGGVIMPIDPKYS